MKNSHCTFITISLELITRNNNKMKKESFSFTHFYNLQCTGRFINFAPQDYHSMECDEINFVLKPNLLHY
jgi:hypothetical protein